MGKHLASLIVAGAFFLVSACTVATASPPTISDTRVPSLKGGSASFDVVLMDQADQRLYAADRTDQGVDVFDVSTPVATYVKTIALQAEPNGLALAPDLGALFAGGSDGSVAMIDTRAGATTVNTVIKVISTGADTVDLVDYSASLHRVYASTATGGTIVSLDAASGQVLGLFKIGYALEQPRFNPGDGLLYVTSPGANALFQLDPSSGAIKQKIALGSCRPTGLGIDPKTNQAMVACGPSVVRINLKNTADTQTFSDVYGGDVVGYDSAVDRFFVASPDAKPAMVGIFGGSPIAFVTSVNTGAGGNSAAYDETNRRVYTPDVRPGTAGIAGFDLPAEQATFVVSPEQLGMLAALIVAIAAFMVLIGRGADPIRRPAPVPAPRRRA